MTEPSSDTCRRCGHSVFVAPDGFRLVDKQGRDCCPNTKALHWIAWPDQRRLLVAP